MEERLERYLRELFAAEDAALVTIRERQAAANLPEINVSAEEGRLLAVLLSAVQAKRVLEIGALGGYSGTWMARALQPGGTMTTIEFDPHHARVAREAYARAGVSDRVELIEGSALDVLPTLQPGFDAVFVDADKAPMAKYFEWGVRLLRIGGLLLGDNAFHDGRVADPTVTAPDTEGVRAFNTLSATDPRINATVIPIRDGLVVGVKVRE
ncbi:MAG TPA: O-methyltransferase [Gemmatimonadales bacterium]|nr:O-methyltransferase [Gemmatimonadales bacterium]